VRRQRRLGAPRGGDVLNEAFSAELSHPAQPYRGWRTEDGKMSKISTLDIAELGEVTHIPDVTTDVEDEYYAIFDRLREAGPVALVESGGVVAKAILRVDDIRTVCTDHERFSSEEVENEGSGYGRPALIPLNLDPPDHTKFRLILGPMFSPAVARDMAPRMREIARELIGNVVGRGNCDFVMEVARPYAGRIFFELVGWPVSDMEPVLQAEEELSIPQAEDPDKSRRAAGHAALAVYVDRKIAEARSKPDGSIMAKLMEERIDDRPITDEELGKIGILAIGGGVHTTKSTLGKMIEYLATHAELQRLLRGQPEKIPAFIEEFMRLKMLGNNYRHVKVDTELSGCPLRRGDLLALHWTSGNRDPRQFDRPTELVIDRKPNKHVALGFGPHMCLGQHIARMDMTIMLQELVSTLPPFHLAGDQKIEQQTLANIGFKTLPIAWD
jgi:cytochrome P450